MVTLARPDTGHRVQNLVTSGAGRLLLVLSAVNVCNFMDRKLISVLLPAMKHDLHLTDSQMGLVTGLAFGVTYAILGLPLSWLSERIDRRKLIAAVLAVWCLMTALSGAALSFVQLLLCRMGVAVGETGASPASYAMISDAYPVANRTAAIAIFTSGGQLGGFLGALIGAWIAQFVSWRAAFAIVGAAGLLLLPFLLFSIKDPPRGQSDGLAGRQAAPFRDAVAAILKVPTFRQNVAASSLSAVVTYSITTWLPSVLVRSYGVSIGEAGTILAAMALIAGAGGAIVGGQLTARLGAKDLRWWAWLPAICFVVATPLMALAILVNNLWVTVGSIALAYSAVSFTYGANYAALNTTVPPRVRATASACALLVITLLGLGIGPLLTGVVSDYFNSEFGKNGLRVALIVPALATLWGALHFFLMARTIRQDADRAVAVA